MRPSCPGAPPTAYASAAGGPMVSRNTSQGLKVRTMTAICMSSCAATGGGEHMRRPQQRPDRACKGYPMDFLLLGRELPTFELRIAMAKPPVLRCAQHALVRLRKGRYGRLETLRWLDVLLEDVEVEALYTAYYMGMQRFADLIGKDHPVQLTFFERFVNWQENQFALPSRCKRDFEGLLREPALLPFMWMNWIPATLPYT